MSETTEDPTKLDFETGYERLKGIGEKLEDPNVPVAQMCDLYAEGRGLGQALLGFLEEKETELEEIDAGKNLPAFEITATAAAPARDGDDDVPADTSDFDGAKAGVGSGDDEIPF